MQLSVVSMFLVLTWECLESFFQTMKLKSLYLQTIVIKFDLPNCFYSSKILDEEENHYHCGGLID
jgi:hypothetical protein